MPTGFKNLSRIRLLAMATIAGVLLVVALARFTTLVDLTELRWQNWLVSATGNEPLPENFALIAIDDSSLNLSSAFPEDIAGSPSLQLMQKAYPWSREVYAQLLEKLKGADARLVIFDMVFPGARDGDAALKQMLESWNKNVLLGSHFDKPSTDSQGTIQFQYVEPTPELRQSGVSVGCVNIPPPVDGVVKSMFLYVSPSRSLGEAHLPGENRYPSLAVQANSLLGGEAPPESTQSHRFRYSQPGTLPVYSLHEIFIPSFWEQNFKNGDVFRDKVILIGATSATAQDFHQTPFGRMSGPEIQLHMLAALQRGAWLGQTSPVVSYLILIGAALGAFVFGLTPRHPLLWTAGLVIGAVLWIGLAMATLHFASFFLPVVAPLAGWFVCGFGILTSDLMLEQKERSRVRGMLERYVSRDVVKEVVDNPNSSNAFLQSLGGQRKEMVVLFSDLKGFTSDSEKTDPAELVSQLNEYFGKMVGVVFKNDGTFDKFIGDALMATWGGIRDAGPQKDASNAVTAAFQMQDYLVEINTLRRERGSTPWACGVGIGQGLAIFGNIGSNDRMEATAIGDAVNLSSRIEGLTRVYGCPILTDERIARNAAAVCDFLLVDEVRVKGRRKPEKLFFPYRRQPGEWADAFTAARLRYLARDFAGARESFEKLAAGGLAPGLARRFLNRCEDFLRTPPENGWTGIWDFLEK